MKISKIHKKFASYLESQRVLTIPENYLGPNWEAVINFWLYLDTLTEEQLKVVGERYVALGREELNIACDKAWSAAADATDFADDAETAAYYSVSCASSAACQATRELIGLQKLLDQGYQPVFLPLFLNL